MTNTRINHTGHDHPNTTAARTACRKSMDDKAITVAIAKHMDAIEADEMNRLRKPRQLRIGMEIKVNDGWVKISDFCLITTPGSRGLYVITLANGTKIECEGGRTFETR